MTFSRTLTSTRLHGLTLALALGAACGDDPLADGTLQVTIYGEDYIEDRIPAADVADGWSIDFSRFLVAVSHVGLGKDADHETLAAHEIRVFDLTKPSNGLGHLVASGDAAGGVYDVLAYTVGPAATGAIAGNATSSDVAEMIAGGFAVLVEGTATKAGDAIDFMWGFGRATRYAPCETGARVDGGTASSQITIHADHLFYDSLVSESPDVRFQLVADADGNADGAVTLEELAAVDITALSNYQVGNQTQVTNLRAFIEAQIGTLGHVDGEGHCETE